MTYRLLEPEEWPRLEEVYVREFGHSNLPDPLASQVIVAEEGGEILGMLVGQYVFHSEPLWVDKRAKHRFVIANLIKTLHDECPGLTRVFACVRTTRMGRFLEKLGMMKLPDIAIYRWTKDE